MDSHTESPVKSVSFLFMLDLPRGLILCRELNINDAIPPWLYLNMLRCPLWREVYDNDYIGINVSYLIDFRMEDQRPVVSSIEQVGQTGVFAAVADIDLPKDNKVAEMLATQYRCEIETFAEGLVSAMGPSADHPGHDPAQQAAEQATRTGNRRDLMRYFRLRQQK